MSNNNNNKHIERLREIQVRIMQADPFLVTEMSSKTTSEITNILEEMTRNASFVARQSPDWYRKHKEAMSTLSDIIALRQISEDDMGGVSLV